MKYADLMKEPVLSFKVVFVKFEMLSDPGFAFTKLSKILKQWWGGGIESELNINSVMVELFSIRSCFQFQWKMKNISSLGYLLCAVLTCPKTLNTNVCFSSPLRVRSSTKTESAIDISTVLEGWGSVSS